MLMDGFFCAGGSVGIITTPLFLPSTPLTFGVNWTPPPRQKARPPSRGRGFGLPLSCRAFSQGRTHRSNSNAKPQSFPFFSRFALASSPCQRSRQWIQKKGRECVNTPRPAGQSPDGIIASARHDQVFRPCKRLQLLQGQTVIYGLTSRQTGPPRRQPRFPQQRQAGTAPYGHPPFRRTAPGPF